MFVTSSPFLHNNNSVSLIMGKVLLCLLPALLLWHILFGWAAFIQSVLCLSVCYGLEWAVLKLRHKSYVFMKDGSIAVTASLLIFCVPPLSPWWLIVTAAAFATILGKHLFGGLGNNIFNPAMLGYAITLISFPSEYAIWSTPATFLSMTGFASIDSLTLLQVLSIIFANDVAYSVTTSATLLTATKLLSQNVLMIDWFKQYEFWLSLSFLVGGLALLLMRVISWHIPVGFLAGVLGCAIIFSVVNQEYSLAYLGYHLFAGASIIGAFFIATDPTSAATSLKGRVVYGVMVGVLVIIIRELGNYPDGIAFAVLIANIMVPTLDYYLQPSHKS